MTPLERELVAMIAAEGPLGVDRYMALCLGHARHGYYMRKDPFGTGGDFTTAPEISQMFGELIGVWCFATWQAMGAPSALRLIELGPGRGTLMADLLRAARVMPGFNEAATVALVETSSLMRQFQSITLSHTGSAIEWHACLDDVPRGPHILLANEFFDALGFQQFVRTDSAWHERRIGLDEAGKLVFGLAPDPLPPALVPPWAHGATPGEVIELSPARNDLARAIGVRLKAMGGAALIFDYGHARSAPGDTFQAIRAHAFQNVLDRPGESDLTCHVDFEALAAALGQGGAKVHGPLAQSAFLSAMGLSQRAGVLKRHADRKGRTEIDAAVDRLAGQAQMGHLFQVIAATHPDMTPPFPFQQSCS